MILKGLVDEDIVNYYKTSMYLIFPTCDFKCERDCGELVCQNSCLAQAATVEISQEAICERYLHNPLTSAIVCGGLEPFDSPFDLLGLIDKLRRKYGCPDDVVIYTGYTEEELNELPIYNNLKLYKNIIVKFGRFIPNKESHYDSVLKVNLASPNQYAKRLNDED